MDRLPVNGDPARHAVFRTCAAFHYRGERPGGPDWNHLTDGRVCVVKGRGIKRGPGIIDRAQIDVRVLEPTSEGLHSRRGFKAVGHELPVEQRLKDPAESD